MSQVMEIITRAQWGAKPPKRSVPKMKLPVKEVWLHHTVTPVTNDPLADCRLVQQTAFNRGFIDISYCYLFHPSGAILEGRGLGVGAHTEGRNSISFGLSLIGNYDLGHPTEVQIDGVRWVIDKLIDGAMLRGGTYPTGGHRDLKPTACPGRDAYVDLGKFRIPWVPPAPIPQEGVVVVNRPPVTLLAHPNGYWEITDDGGVFGFTYEGAETVPFYGSTGATALNKPIVDAAATPDFGGYWLVAADGGIFSFGNAQFYGSTGNVTLNRPIRSITVAPDGKGYWLMAEDGGVFAFGSAKFAGRVQYG